MFLQNGWALGFVTKTEMGKMCTSKDSAAVSEENSGCSGRVPKDSPVSARQDSEDVGLS